MTLSELQVREVTNTGVTWHAPISRAGALYTVGYRHIDGADLYFAWRCTEDGEILFGRYMMELQLVGVLELALWLVDATPVEDAR